jgi:hypothetical protein
MRAPRIPRDASIINTRTNSCNTVKILTSFQRIPTRVWSLRASRQLRKSKKDWISLSPGAKRNNLYHVYSQGCSDHIYFSRFRREIGAYQPRAFSSLLVCFDGNPTLGTRQSCRTWALRPRYGRLVKIITA